ncbi:hypothetical protein EST38_g11245 [Candolleomyces aberdarensis]|uniref:Uncharacterized protein n=1 Tax=Candolleomyces aberdarensis TaxID=2316362 RepID=A0A4Q2D5A5_9AGAR|nr:hypothetical protein EST38_g11245 [Candolleomyces aberdarensis]
MVEFESVQLQLDFIDLNVEMPQDDARSKLFGKPGSLLFGTPQPKPAITAGSMAATTTSTPAPTMNLVNTSSLGYFAFPQGSSSAYASFDFGVSYASSSSPEPRKPARDAETQWAPSGTKTCSQEQIDADYEAHQQRLKKLHEERLAREAEEARKGEEYWVSCGGVLRDEFGRRDMDRTKAIREELKLREVEKRLTEMWEEHERRWKELVARTGGRKRNAPSSSLSESSVFDQPEKTANTEIESTPYLKFADIPWPVQLQDDDSKVTRPLTLQDLTRERIEGFLLAPLTVRGCTITRKDRVRSSLLRWHPDKMSSIIKQTDPREKEDVMEGIHAVIRCLHRLNAGS